MKLNCDFCSNPIAKILASCWSYPCADLSIDGPPGAPAHTFVGAWLACDPCGTIIETGDINALAERVLAERALAGGSDSKSDLPCEIRDGVKARVVEMYTVFMHYRLGPRHRPTDEEQEKTRANRALNAYRCHFGVMKPGYQSEHCPNHADLELAAPGPIKWFPTCRPCALSALKLPTDAEIVFDGVRTRHLSGVSPEELVNASLPGD